MSSKMTDRKRIAKHKALNVEQATPEYRPVMMKAFLLAHEVRIARKQFADRQQEIAERLQRAAADLVAQAERFDPASQVKQVAHVQSGMIELHQMLHLDVWAEQAATIERGIATIDVLRMLLTADEEQQINAILHS